MQLISCPVCKKEISSESSDCIHCGHPLKNDTASKKKPQTRPWAWIFLGLFIALGIAYLLSDEFKESNRPELPISLQHRAAMLDDSRVIKITNISTNNIRVIATFERPQTGEVKTETLNLAGNDAISIGQLEGWGFKSGDIITLKSDKFKSWKGSIP